MQKQCLNWIEASKTKEPFYAMKQGIGGGGLGRGLVGSSICEIQRNLHSGGGGWGRQELYHSTR